MPIALTAILVFIPFGIGIVLYKVFKTLRKDEDRSKGWAVLYCVVYLVTCVLLILSIYKYCVLMGFL